jgi:hypothetical protein
MSPANNNGHGANADATPPENEVFADMATIIELLTANSIALTPRAAFCLLVIGYGILEAYCTPEDARELQIHAKAMARELVPQLLARVPNLETL